MSANILATRSNPFDAVYQIEESERLLSRNANHLFQTAMEPTIDDIETMYAWKTALVKPQEPPVDSTSPPKVNSNPNLQVTLDQSALQERTAAKVDQKFSVHINFAIKSAAKEKFLNALQLATNETTSNRGSELNDMNESSVIQMMETGAMDTWLETKLSTLAESNHFMDALVRRVIGKKSFITSVADFISTTVDDHIEIAEVQAFV